MSLEGLRFRDCELLSDAKVIRVELSSDALESELRRSSQIVAQGFLPWDRRASIYHLTLKELANILAPREDSRTLSEF